VDMGRQTPPPPGSGPSIPQPSSSTGSRGGWMEQAGRQAGGREARRPTNKTRRTNVSRARPVPWGGGGGGGGDKPHVTKRSLSFRTPTLGPLLSAGMPLRDVVGCSRERRAAVGGGGIS
jgi:hypothetical protein